MDVFVLLCCLIFAAVYSVPYSDAFPIHASHGRRILLLAAIVFLPFYIGGAVLAGFTRTYFVTTLAWGTWVFAGIAMACMLFRRRHIIFHWIQRSLRRPVNEELPPVSTEGEWIASRPNTPVMLFAFATPGPLGLAAGMLLGSALNTDRVVPEVACILFGCFVAAFAAALICGFFRATVCGNSPWLSCLAGYWCPCICHS